MKSVADDLGAEKHFRQRDAEQKRDRRDQRPLVPFLLDVLSWERGAPPDHKSWISTEDFKKLPATELRVVFAPLDDFQLQDPEPFLDLLKIYGVPPAFLTERIQAVSYSFCRRKLHDGSELVWFHYLCKNVRLGRQDATSIHTSHEDFNWITSAFILHIAPKQNNHATSVTLLCFGASKYLSERFNRLQEDFRWMQILESPLTILSLVLDELYIRMDRVVWNLGHVFGEMESKILEAAKPKEWKSSKIPNIINFVGLHNISKQSIYLLESTASFIEIIEHLKHISSQNPSTPGLTTEDELFSYHLSAVNSTRNRLNSLDRRITNLINLAFNLVTQSDSRTVKVDSKLMTLIAVVTMVFLPMNTIAAIFSGPFFTSEFQYVDEVKSDELHMLSKFWLFWVVVIPVTVIIMLLSWMYWEKVRIEYLWPGSTSRARGTFFEFWRRNRTQMSLQDGA